MNDNELSSLIYSTINCASTLSLVRNGLDAINTIGSNEDCGHDFHADYDDLCNALSLVIDELNQHSDKLDTLELKEGGQK
jgi:hypothetical protein